MRPNSVQINIFGPNYSSTNPVQQSASNSFIYNMPAKDLFIKNPSNINPVQQSVPGNAYTLPTKDSFMRQIGHLQQKILEESGKVNPGIVAGREKMMQIIQGNIATLKPEITRDSNSTQILASFLQAKDGAETEQIIGNLPESEKNKLLELRRDEKKINAQSDAEAAPLIKSTERYYQEHLNDYDRYIFNNRLKPEDTEMPHPKNTRVLSAISQNEVSPGPEQGSKLNWATRRFNESLQTESSIDNAINKTQNATKLWGKQESAFPRLQKPVSTLRENQQAWRKSDNGDTNVKRIAIFFSADDGSGCFDAESATIQQNFKEQSISEYNASTRPAKDKSFRVDELVTVKIDSPEKIEQSLRQVNLYVQQEREKARQNAIQKAKQEGKSNEEQAAIGESAANQLRFEGFTGWFGHGTILKDKDPNGDAIYQEGSREFAFLIPDNKQLSETQIKQLEHQYLNEDTFKYFVHYFDGCRSGAMIA